MGPCHGSDLGSNPSSGAFKHRGTRRPAAPVALDEARGVPQPPAWVYDRSTPGRAMGHRARAVAMLVLLALAAGCADPAPAIAVAHESGSSPDLPGVTAHGSHNVTGRAHAIEVVARNAGPSTYYVYTSQSGAWSDSVRGPDGEVTIRNNAYTQECGWTAFAPGDVLRDVVTWDETLYQGQDGQGRDHPTKPAPPGH